MKTLLTWAAWIVGALGVLFVLFFVYPEMSDKAIIGWSISVFIGLAMMEYGREKDRREMFRAELRDRLRAIERRLGI